MYACTSRKGVWAGGNKRIAPFVFIYRWHEKEVVGQLQGLAALSLDYEAGVVPRCSLNALKRHN
jgi:hypothetical protein